MEDLKKVKIYVPKSQHWVDSNIVDEDEPKFTYSYYYGENKDNIVFKFNEKFINVG